MSGRASARRRRIRGGRKGAVSGLEKFCFAEKEHRSISYARAARSMVARLEGRRGPSTSSGLVLQKAQDRAFSCPSKIGR